MRTAYLTALRQIEIREESRPELRGQGDVLVRIERVGVCGSDVHYWAEGRIGNDLVRYPATLGHECAGTVAEVGSRVTTVRPGDRVVIDPAMTCGQCDQCKAGREHTCRDCQFMGCTGQAPGAAADYRVLPESNCYPVPPSMSLDEAALVEPLSIGLYAVRLASPRPGARMAVLGTGPIGLCVLLCAKALDECDVAATDRIDSRLDVARACGADWTGNPTAQDVVADLQARAPLGLDVVFECSGDPACIDQAIELLGPGGTLVLVGIPPTERVDFDIHAARRKELVLKNVRRQNHSIRPVIDLLAQGRLDPGRLVTHHFPLAQIQNAFELVAGYHEGVIKAMVDLSLG
ncbi:MAG: alcohol dehydrogenase catalytic domain-containing protein [Pirellulales bacterium]|nr:alcohol dehydrogenase catalytic domain-containing protein [Pirellulales bacterium]